MQVKISAVKANKNNPRQIKDDKFKKLVQSIKEFPEMLEKRPLVCFTDTDGKLIVLGGNMRLKAAKEAGLKEVPIIFADDLTEDEQKQFIIKDNIGFGEWDWEMLANEWEPELLQDWGLEVWKPSDVNLDEFFEDNSESNTEEEGNTKIILEYTQADYDLVIEAFKNHSGTKEQILFKLLGL